MNERIKELAEQAGLRFTQLMCNPMVPVVDGKETDLEKFAELIMKECSNWFNNRLVVEPESGMEHRVERNRAVVGVMKEFNQHFGVEV